MAIIVTLVSTKGGVGKTSFTAHSGAVLAVSGQRVLLIDADVQPSLASYYRIAQSPPCGLAELVTVPILADVVSRRDIDFHDVVVSNDPDGKLQNWLLYTFGEIHCYEHA